MKQPARKGPYGAPRADTPQPVAEPGSVGHLARELIAEAQALAEVDRAEAASRGPMTKLLLLLTLVAFFSAGSTTIYGIYNFPDAPIRLRGGAYVGKGDTTRTRQDYENFLSWSRAMWVTYPATFLIGSAFVWADSRSRRSRRREADAARSIATR